MEECQGMEIKIQAASGAVETTKIYKTVNGDHCDGRRASQGSNLHYLIYFAQAMQRTRNSPAAVNNALEVDNYFKKISSFARNHFVSHSLIIFVRFQLTTAEKRLCSELESHLFSLLFYF